MISDIEWDALTALIREGWPGGFDQHAADAWRTLFELLDVDTVVIARGIAACVARGGHWRPAVSEIVAEIRRLQETEKPTFPDALNAIFERGGVLAARTQVRKSRWAPGERDRLDEQAALDRAKELHPLIGAFVNSQGLDRLRRLDIDDVKWGEARRKQLRTEWEELVDVYETREVAELVAGDRRAKLGRFDPAAVLERFAS